MLLLIVVATVLYSGQLVRELKQEEQKRMEIWSEATRQLIMADEDTDIDFVSSIIEDNTTIPVYVTDSAGQILLSRNAKRSIRDPRTLHGPIELALAPDNIQYIWYDDSNLLRRLRYFPYVQLSLILAFLLLAALTLIAIERSEQNRLWVGLTKETAHQLGTPISSLNGWLLLLRDNYPDEPYLRQMQTDIDRLNIIAERFSKVGSIPDLTPADLPQVVEETVIYMRSRLPHKTHIAFVQPNDAQQQSVLLSIPLFSWVLENLMKNAVDAGATDITLALSEDTKSYQLTVADNGRGMDKTTQRRIFEPGYTTKKRGWGLGLSMAKRIIENYHRGKITLKSSEPGVGTTFCITLKKAVNR